MVKNEDTTYEFYHCTIIATGEVYKVYEIQMISSILTMLQEDVLFTIDDVHTLASCMDEFFDEGDIKFRDKLKLVQALKDAKI